MAGSIAKRQPDPGVCASSALARYLKLAAVLLDEGPGKGEA